MSHGYDIERDMRTLKVTDIDPKVVNEDLLYELFSQFGVVADVRWQTVSRDKSRHQSGQDSGPALLYDKVRENTAYVEYRTSSDAEYAFQVLRDCRIQLYGKEMKVIFRALNSLEKLSETGGVLDVHSVEKRGGISLFDIGAKLYVSNFNKSITVNELREFFSKFGPFAVDVRLITDRDGVSKGACVVSYQSFEVADAVLNDLQGQIWRDRYIKIEYADLGDGSGRKHGSAEERERALKFMDKERTHAANIAASQEEMRRQQQVHAAGNLPSWAQEVPQARAAYGRV